MSRRTLSRKTSPRVPYIASASPVHSERETRVSFRAPSHLSEGFRVRLRIHSTLYRFCVGVGFLVSSRGARWRFNGTQLFGRLVVRKTLLARAGRSAIWGAFKEELICRFREETSSDCLRTLSCVCCSSAVPKLELQVVPLNELPLDLLRDQELRRSSPTLPMPLDIPRLEDVVLDPRGLAVENDR